MKAILAGRDEPMFMKLIVERASDRVIGVHILGPDAAEIVQMAAIAIRMWAPKRKTSIRRWRYIHQPRRNS